MLIENYSSNRHRQFNHEPLIKSPPPPGYPQGDFGDFLAPIDPHNELLSYSPTELRTLFDDQYTTADKAASVYVKYKLMNKTTYDETLRQYKRYYFHRNQDQVTTVYHKDLLLADIQKKIQRNNTISNAPEDVLPPESNPTIKNKDPVDIKKDEEPSYIYNDITFAGKTSIQTIGISIQSIRNITGYSFIVQKEWHPAPVTITWQQKLLQNTSNILVINGCRQMGKSYVTAELLVEESFIPGADILVAAFLQKSTNLILNYMKSFLYNFNEEDFTVFKKDGYIQNNASGVRIHFRTLADGGQNVLGLTLRLIVIDEAQLISQDIFNEVLKPTLATTGGRIILIGTAIENTSSFMYKTILEIKKGQLYNNPGQKTASLISISVDENPLMHPLERKEVEDHKDSPAIQRQYYNKWGKSTDSMFNIIPTPLPDLPSLSPHGTIIYAMDPARIKDRSAYAILHAYNQKLTLIKSGEVPSNFKMSWESQAQFHKAQIQSLRDQHYKNIKTAIDWSGVGDGVVSIYRQQGLQIDYQVRYASGINDSEQGQGAYIVGKSMLIAGLLDFIEMGILKVPRETNDALLEEVQYINIDTNPQGQLRFKSDFFDDITNALMIGIYISKKFQFHNREAAPDTPDQNAFGKEIDSHRGTNYQPQKPLSRIF